MGQRVSQFCVNGVFIRFSLFSGFSGFCVFIMLSGLIVLCVYIILSGFSGFCVFIMLSEFSICNILTVLVESVECVWYLFSVLIASHRKFCTPPGRLSKSKYCKYVMEYFD
jgi:hypothetical protein